MVNTQVISASYNETSSSFRMESDLFPTRPFCVAVFLVSNFFFSSSFQFQICRIMQFLKTHMDVVQIPGSRAHGEGFGVLAGLTRSGTRGFVSD